LTNVTLASGRVVTLDLFHALPAYLAFNLSSATGTFEDRIAELVQQMHYGSGLRRVVLPPPNRLPGSWYLCIAQFSSEPLSGIRDVAVQGSYLTVCWFVESVDEPIPSLAERALSAVVWEAQARDDFSDW
jgi:hypothetical protein